MIDELPGFASEMTAHENAIAAALADGWEIKGFSITWNGSDTLMVCLLWKTGAQPDPTSTTAFGKRYGPLRAALRERHASSFASLSPPCDALRKTKPKRK
jgi:hypothetical protein